MGHALVGHFLPGAGNTLFELAFTNDLTDVRVHMKCSTPMKSGCIYPMPPELWRWVAGTNRGGRVQVTVKGRFVAHHKIKGTFRVQSPTCGDSGAIAYTLKLKTS